MKMQWEEREQRGGVLQVRPGGSPHDPYQPCGVLAFTRWPLPSSWLHLDSTYGECFGVTSGASGNPLGFVSTWWPPTHRACLPLESGVNNRRACLLALGFRTRENENGRVRRNWPRFSSSALLRHPGSHLIIFFHLLSLTNILLLCLYLPLSMHNILFLVSYLAILSEQPPARTCEKTTRK